MWGTVAVALITALSTLAAAIMSQTIGSNSAVNIKKIDVLFTRKSDEYKNTLEKAGEFGIAPKELSKFLSLQSAIHAASLVASEEVAKVLDADPRISLHMNATRLRLAENEEEVVRLQTHEWYEVLERLKTAMRADLTRFAEPEVQTIRSIWRTLAGR